MPSSIKEDGKLEKLDLTLVVTSKHALLKVANPSSSRVAAVRPERPNVLDVIRAQGEIILKKN